MQMMCGFVYMILTAIKSNSLVVRMRTEGIELSSATRTPPPREHLSLR